MTRTCVSRGSGAIPSSLIKRLARGDEDRMGEEAALVLPMAGRLDIEVDGRNGVNFIPPPPPPKLPVLLKLPG